MVKVHRDKKRGNLLPLFHGLLFPITDRMAHTVAFDTPVSPIVLSLLSGVG